MKWKVSKARNSDWWAHHPGCRQFGYLICVLFNECQNCGNFNAAIFYADYMATKKPSVLESDIAAKVRVNV